MSRKFSCPSFGPAISSSWTTSAATRGKAVRQLIRSVDAKLFFLPKYLPDLNPIEQVFAKLKRLSTCSEKLSREPSMQSAPQSPRHSMTSPPMNAPTISKIQDIESNAITLLMPDR
jgi:hypothetical protein